MARDVCVREFECVLHHCRSILLDGSHADKACSVSFLAVILVGKREVCLIECLHFVFAQRFMMTMYAFVLELFLLLGKDLTNLLFKKHDG